MLVIEVLRSVNCLDKFWPAVIWINPCSSPYFIDPDKLLVKLAGSIMKTLKWRNNCNIDIFIVIMSHHASFNGTLEVIPKEPRAIRAIPHEAVDQNDGIIVAPVRFIRNVPILALHQVNLLKLVDLLGKLMKEVDHKHKHDNSHVVVPKIDMQVLGYDPCVVHEPEQKHDLLNRVLFWH